MKPEMCDIATTAARYNISKYYARTLALSGKVKAVRVGRGKILINQQSMDDYFNSSYLTSERAETYGEIRRIVK